jgi:hypothetical protein
MFGKVTLHEKGEGMGSKAFTWNRYKKFFKAMGFTQFFTISQFCVEVSLFSRISIREHWRLLN